MQCIHKTKTGEACKAHAVTETGLCFSHSPRARQVLDVKRILEQQLKKVARLKNANPIETAKVTIELIKMIGSIPTPEADAEAEKEESEMTPAEKVKAMKGRRV